MKELSTRETYSFISFICFAIVAIPIILILYQGHEVEIRDKYPGMVHVESGKLFVKNKEEAFNDPKNQPILIAENLNNYASILVLENPAYRGLLKSPQINTILKTLARQSENPPMEEITKATSKSVRWSPDIGAHGLFFLNPQKAPNSILTFGTVYLPGGKELSTYQTEKAVNRILFELRKTSENKKDHPTTVRSLMEKTLRQPQPLISSSEAINLIGLCDGLNIKYNPELELFTSKETESEILTWQERLIN